MEENLYGQAYAQFLQGEIDDLGNQADAFFHFDDYGGVGEFVVESRVYSPVDYGPGENRSAAG